MRRSGWDCVFGAAVLAVARGVVDLEEEEEVAALLGVEAGVVFAAIGAALWHPTVAAAASKVAAIKILFIRFKSRFYLRPDKPPAHAAFGLFGDTRP